MSIRTVSSTLVAVGLVLAATVPGSAAGAVTPAAAGGAAVPATSTVSLPPSRSGDYLQLQGEAVGRLSGLPGNTHTVSLQLAGNFSFVEIRSYDCAKGLCNSLGDFRGPATVQQDVSSTTRSARVTGTLRTDAPSGRILVPFDIPMYAVSAPHEITTNPDIASWARNARLASGASIGRLALHNRLSSPSVSGEYGRYRYVTAP